MRPKTFKPRTSLARSASGEYLWCKVGSTRASKSSDRPPVWARLGARQGSIHDRLGRKITSVKDRLGPRIPPSDFTSLLRARAEGRCFNCFAPDHRIAQCRDPPKCIMCSRSGHKAKHCSSSEAGRKKEPTAKAAPREPSPRRKKMELPLDPTPGAPVRRVERITACTSWSGDLRVAEREVAINGLVAVQLDARVRLTCEAVRRDVLHQLHIPEHELMVTRLKPAWFLLRFESPQRRSRRQDSVREPYWLAAHALDQADSERERDEEIGCFCLWLWTSDPDAIAKEGVLQISKPVVDAH